MTSPIENLPSRLRLKWIAEYHGPNPYADAAVVVGELPGDAEAVLALAQSAAARALADLNEVRGHVLNAGAVRAGGAIHLWVGFHQPKLTRTAVEQALRALTQGTHGQARPADLDRLGQSCRRHHPDYQARILMVGADDMGLPYLHFLPDSRYWQFGWGAKSRVFLESGSNADGLLGSYWAKNKVRTKALLGALGLPTPAHVLVQQAADLPAAVARVGFPCVVKPLDSGGGKGVTANIRSLVEAQTAFGIARRESQGHLLVEAHVEGMDHRLMVINGELVAAIRREPSFFVGDGVRPVSSFIAELNATRSTNMIRSRYRRPIALDDVLDTHLRTQGLSLEAVPKAGQRVSVRSNANLSTGGMCTDVTATCHPQVRAMAEQLARSSGLATIGIDYLTTDLSRPPGESGGAFIEMNTTPGLDACIAAGWPEARIARLVLGPGVGRIPIELTVLGAGGMQALRQGLHGRCLAADQALVIGDELRIGEMTLQPSTPEPWAAVKAALRNVCIQRVQVVCTLEQLVRLGCPVDRVDQVRVSSADDVGRLPPPWREVLDRACLRGVTVVPEQPLLLDLLDVAAAIAAPSQAQVVPGDVRKFP